MAAAKREAYEETHIQGCRWHASPFLTTDAIFPDNNLAGAFEYHYVIAHCFARAPVCDGRQYPTVVPSDDALDAKWFSLTELREFDRAEQLSSGVMDVIERAEELNGLGALPVD